MTTPRGCPPGTRAIPGQPGRPVGLGAKEVRSGRVPEPLLNVLKICLLILLYLFFYRVMRAVWAEVNLGRNAAPAPTAPGSAPRRRPGRPNRRRAAPPGLVVVAPDDLAGQRYALGDEITIGRAAGCQITLDDTYASQIHARVFTRDGQLYVEDLGSTNGTYLNRRKVAAAMVVSHGDQLQVGSTIMEVS